MSKMNLIGFLLALFIHIFKTTSLALNNPIPNLLFPAQPLKNLTSPFPLTTSLTTNDHITCAHVDTPIGLHPTYCSTAINIICQKLTENDPRILARDKWVWTELPGCALGYYLPSETSPMLIPSSAECEVGIFLEMVEKCAYDSRFNVGSINVAELPSAEGKGTAQTGGDGVLRYALAPLALDNFG